MVFLQNFVVSSNKNPPDGYYNDVESILINLVELNLLLYQTENPVTMMSCVCTLHKAITKCLKITWKNIKIQFAILE